MQIVKDIEKIKKPISLHIPADRVSEEKRQARERGTHKAQARYTNVVAV